MVYERPALGRCGPPASRRLGKAPVWVLGAGYIEKTGNIGALGFYPALPTTDGSCPSNPEEAVADRKTRLIDALREAGRSPP